MVEINKIKDLRKISNIEMNRDTKKSLKIVGGVYPEIVQVQIRDYCAKNYAVIIKNLINQIQK